MVHIKEEVFESKAYVVAFIVTSHCKRDISKSHWGFDGCRRALNITETAL